MKPITIKEVEHVAFILAKKHLDWNEPIPDFSTRSPGVLESCIANAFQTYAKKELYPTLVDKASIIFYLMIKDHPFFNGNKRIAVTTLLVFLYINDKWIKVTDEELYQLAVWVAESPPKLKKGVMVAIKDFIKQNMISIRI